MRADASVAMGSGHIMRCLALAQVWQDSGGQVVFAARELTPAIARRLRAEGMEIETCGLSNLKEDAGVLAALSRRRCATTVVVDGYQFDSAYQRDLRDFGLHVLWIDDIGQCGPYCAHVVLNQNAYAHAGMYINRDPGTKLLLGPHYLLLRKEFFPWQLRSRKVAVVPRRLLVMMGGSDSENFITRVITAIQTAGVGALEITVVIGGSNPHRESLYDLASRSPENIRLLVDVKNMAEVMADADLAISAAGHTCYELALLQVPMVLISLAENQILAARAMAHAHAAIDGGWFGSFESKRFGQLIQNAAQNYDLRCRLAQNAQRLVDGRGAYRTFQCLRQNAAESSEGLSTLQAGVC